jgi:hypothetical protein
VVRTAVIAVLLPALFMTALAGTCFNCSAAQTSAHGSDCCPKPDHCKAPGRTPVRKSCATRDADLSTAAQESHYPVIIDAAFAWVNPAVAVLATSTPDHVYVQPQYSPPDLRLLYSVLNI